MNVNLIKYLQDYFIILLHIYKWYSVLRVLEANPPLPRTCVLLFPPPLIPNTPFALVWRHLNDTFVHRDRRHRSCRSVDLIEYCGPAKSHDHSSWSATFVSCTANTYNIAHITFDDFVRLMFLCNFMICETDYYTILLIFIGFIVTRFDKIIEFTRV